VVRKTPSAILPTLFADNATAPGQLVAVATITRWRDATQPALPTRRIGFSLECKMVARAASAVAHMVISELTMHVVRLAMGMRERHVGGGARILYGRLCDSCIRVHTCILRGGPALLKAGADRSTE
jgi:hypothetical protein